MSLPFDKEWLPLKYNTPKNFVWRDQTCVCMRVRGGIYQVRLIRYADPVAAVRQLRNYKPPRFAMVGWTTSGVYSYRPVAEPVLWPSLRAAIAHAVDLLLERQVEAKLGTPATRSATGDALNGLSFGGFGFP